MSELPGGWRQLSLREITEEKAERVGGRREVPVLSSTKHHGLVPSDEYFKNRKIYSEDLTNYKVVNRNWFGYATNHLAEGSIGLQERFDVACVSPIYTVFSCKEGVFPPYLFRVLKSPRLIAAYGISEQASVDRRGAVRYRDFGRIRINLPPYQEQRRITEILDTVDLQLTVTGSQIAKASTVDEALSRELLAAEQHTRVPMRDVCSYITVGIVVRPTQFYAESGIPILRSKNITEDGVSLDDVRYMSRANHERNRKSAVRPGDIVTVRTGLPGLSAVVPQDLAEANCVDIIISRPSSDVVPEYLCFWINSDFGRGQILQGQGGLAQQHFNVREMNELEVPIPDLGEQRRISAVLTASKAQVQTLQARVKKLKKLREGLTEDLLTGRVRVSDAEAALSAP